MRFKVPIYSAVELGLFLNVNQYSQSLPGVHWTTLDDLDCGKLYIFL